MYIRKKANMHEGLCCISPKGGLTTNRKNNENKNIPVYTEREDK